MKEEALAITHVGGVFCGSYSVYRDDIIPSPFHNFFSFFFSMKYWGGEGVWKFGLGLVMVRRIFSKEIFIKVFYY